MNKPNLAQDLQKQRNLEDENLKSLRDGKNGAPAMMPQGTQDAANDLDRAMAEQRAREDACIASLSKTNGAKN
jgi:hypothetical protein